MPLPPDELSALTDAALSAATDGGASNAELRVERIRSPTRPPARRRTRGLV